MAMTLLDYVQDILNDMDSDEVNSIDDTFESQQVAQIVKTTYQAMMSNRNWAHQKKTLQLTSSGSAALPTHMSFENEVKEVVLIQYNCVRAGQTKKVYKPMKWCEPDAFLRMINGRDSSSEDVDTIIDPTGVELLIYNDRPPQYYTSFNDEDLVFDSYDSDVDSTLQESKTQAIAYVMSSWTMQDDFIPDIPMEAEVALLEESKSKAMFKLKQMQDIKAEQEAGRQQRWLSRKNWKVKGGVVYPNYGRKSNKYRRDPTFQRDN